MTCGSGFNYFKQTGEGRFRRKVLGSKGDDCVKKKALSVGVVVFLVVVCGLPAFGDDYKVKRVRLGSIIGWNWPSDSELNESGGSFMFGFDLGIMVKKRVEIYAAPMFQQSADIMFLGIGDTFTALHFLLGAYYHVLPPRPWLDIKVGGGLDFGTVTFEQRDDKKGTGIWIGAALEIPVPLGFVEPRFGLEGRYQSLRIDTGGTKDFGGFQLLGSFRLGF